MDSLTDLLEELPGLPALVNLEYHPAVQRLPVWKPE